MSNENDQQNISMLEAALEFVALTKRPAFPCWERHCRTNDKTGKPEGAKSPRTTHGFKDATTDTDQIVEWWSMWPYALIGSPVPPSKFVLDTDPRSGGILESLESVTGELPKTFIVRSGRGDGGGHYYFRRPEEVGKFTDTQLKQVAPGIDLRDGGLSYCIMPPSPHPDTRRPYRYEPHEFADPPESLIELLTAAPPKRPVFDLGRRRRPGSSRKLTGIIRRLQETPEGDRNKALYRATHRVIEGGYRESALDLLSEAAHDIGLSSHEIKSTIESALNKAAQS